MSCGHFYKYRDESLRILCITLWHTSWELDEMDYFLGKYKVVKLSKRMEKLDNPVADEETEILSKIYLLKEPDFKLMILVLYRFPEKGKVQKMLFKANVTLLAKRIAQENNRLFS